jgi:hypothetical protein
MKKSILVWVLSLTLGVTSTYARTDEGTNVRAENSFKKEFATATNVQWEQTKDFTKATFSLNDQVMFAYYSQEGDLLAVTRNILSSQLPINLLADLKKNYNTYWITDLFEMATNDATSYYVSIESGDYTIVLKSDGANGWQVFKKERKNLA